MVFIALLLLLAMPKPQQADETKYLASLLYLKTNAEINGKIKKYFKRQLKKNEMDCDFLSFNVASDIYFQPLSNFQDQINYDKYPVRKEFVNDPLKYKRIYGFESYRSDLLTQLIPRNSSRLYLAFSKPVNNYLIAEFYVQEDSFEHKLSSVNETLKRGTFVHLLFFFKKDGSVDDVYLSGFHYN